MTKHIWPNWYLATISECCTSASSGKPFQKDFLTLLQGFAPIQSVERHRVLALTLCDKAWLLQNIVVPVHPEGAE